MTTTEFQETFNRAFDALPQVAPGRVLVADVRRLHDGLVGALRRAGERLDQRYGPEAGDLARETAAQIQALSDAALAQ
jgi:hypothetical protein